MTSKHYNKHDMSRKNHFHAKNTKYFFYRFFFYVDGKNFGESLYTIFDNGYEPVKHRYFLSFKGMKVALRGLQLDFRK